MKTSTTISMMVISMMMFSTTSFGKTNVSVKNLNGNQPRTEQVEKVTPSNTVCKGLKNLPPDMKKSTEQVKKQEPKKCTSKECQKKNQKKNQKKQVTKVSKVNPQKHIQVRK